MNKSNPFLNIFNGQYSRLNNQENLLANGLLNKFFHNGFHGYIKPQSLMNIGLEHFPIIVSNTNPNTSHITYPGFLGAITRLFHNSNFNNNQSQLTRFPIHTGFFGNLERIFTPHTNNQPHLTNSFSGIINRIFAQ